MFMVLFCATACSNEELTENTPIFVDFSVFDSNEWNEVSRGDALTTSTLYSKGFGVFAYYKATTKPDFINNSKVTSDNSGKTWNYSPKKYWPHDQADKIDFYAYAPYSAMQQIDGTTMSFTVNQAVSEQIDFVWSNSKTTNLNKNLHQNIYAKFLLLIYFNEGLIIYYSGIYP